MQGALTIFFQISLSLSLFAVSLSSPTIMMSSSPTLGLLAIHQHLLLYFIYRVK
ncbi:hypothetical protein Hanom_Chr14g01330011 [Helianthus anomalus]